MPWKRSAGAIEIWKNARREAPVRKNRRTESNKKKRQLPHLSTSQPARMGHPEASLRIEARPPAKDSKTQNKG